MLDWAIMMGSGIEADWADYAGYLEALEARLKAQGVPARAMLTKSNGGVMTAGRACSASSRLRSSARLTSLLGTESWSAKICVHFPTSSNCAVK